MHKLFPFRQPLRTAFGAESNDYIGTNAQSLCYNCTNPSKWRPSSVVRPSVFGRRTLHVLRPIYNNNNNNNNHDDIYSAVIYGASHVREFTVVHLGQSRSAPGGRQLVGQAANLTFESACIGCYRPNIRPSPCIYYSTIRLILIYRSSEGGRLSRPRHCSQCSVRAQSCVSQ